MAVVEGGSDSVGDRLGEMDPTPHVGKSLGLVKLQFVWFEKQRTVVTPPKRIHKEQHPCVAPVGNVFVVERRGIKAMSLWNDRKSPSPVH